LNGEDVYLVDGLRSVKIHLQPVRRHIRRPVSPTAAGAPVDALAVAVSGPARRKRAAVIRRGGGDATIRRQHHIHPYIACTSIDQLNDKRVDSCLASKGCIGT